MHFEETVMAVVHSCKGETLNMLLMSNRLCFIANCGLKTHFHILGVLYVVNRSSYWRSLVALYSLHFSPPISCSLEPCSLPPCLKKTQQLTDRVPIKEILHEPHKSRHRSRRPFVIEAA